MARWEEDDMPDDIDEGYEDVDEGFSESASEAGIPLKSADYSSFGSSTGFGTARYMPGRDVDRDIASTRVSRGVHRGGGKSSINAGQCLTYCGVVLIFSVSCFELYRWILARAPCADLEHTTCPLADAACTPPTPSCAWVPRNVYKEVGEFVGAASTPNTSTAEQSIDAQVKAMLGTHAYVVDPQWNVGGDACVGEDATLPKLESARGLPSRQKGWRIVQERFRNAEFPVPLRVIKGYGPEDFSRVDLEAQLGKGNETHPMSPKCPARPKDAMWALSHIRAWRHVHECCKDAPFALFLENDAYPHPELMTALRKLPQWLAAFPAARVIYLGWCFSYTHETGWLDSFVAGVPDELELVKFSGAQCTHAYMLHRSILPQLLAEATPFNFPSCHLDRFLQAWTQTHLPNGVFGLRASDSAKYAPAKFMIADEPKYEFDGIVFQAGKRMGGKVRADLDTD